MSVIAQSSLAIEPVAPATQEELAAAVADAYKSGTALYPIGGGTGLSFGLAAKRAGRGLTTTRLNRVIDYPNRDMTITVEAGITMHALAEALARHGQRLPVDAPQASAATLGGVVAASVSGPRRCAYGTMRDYVIGISAVDGRGVAFKAGGRVVKNVAGYDFCKLLTGSRGAIGIITQVTLKLRPIAEATAFVTCDVEDFDRAEMLLAALVQSSVTPAAIELLTGPAWADEQALGPTAAAARITLAVGLEGTQPEVDWMINQLSREWADLGFRRPRVISGSPAAELWGKLVEFQAAGTPALVVKAAVPPSAVTRFVAAALAIDGRCSIQAHAGNGVLYIKFPEFSSADAAQVLVRGLQPAAARAGGYATVYTCPIGTELTHQAVWGPQPADTRLAGAVKSQLDPKGLFNPGLIAFAC